MNILQSKWATLLGVIGAVALCTFSARAASVRAASDLLSANKVTAPVFASKDKVCVVSQNTGLAMWYNSRNHGFTALKTGENRDASFASTEELMFGADHQMVLDGFDNPSLYTVELGESPFNKFLAGATVGLGAPSGLIFARNGEVYVASRTPECDILLCDPVGALVEATLAQGNASRTDLKVLALKVNAVPEPSSVLLFGLAGLSLTGFRRFRCN